MGDPYPMLSIGGSAQGYEIALAVPIIVKVSLALFAAHDDMIKRAVKLDSGFSRHAGKVSAALCECK
jgi:hypothetical protein